MYQRCVCSGISLPGLTFVYQLDYCTEPLPVGQAHKPMLSLTGPHGCRPPDTMSSSAGHAQGGDFWGGQTPVWEEFGEAIEQDFQLSSRRF